MFKISIRSNEKNTKITSERIAIGYSLIFYRTVMDDELDRKNLRFKCSHIFICRTSYCKSSLILRILRKLHTI